MVVYLLDSTVSSSHQLEFDSTLQHFGHFIKYRIEIHASQLQRLPSEESNNKSKTHFRIRFMFSNLPTLSHSCSHKFTLCFSLFITHTHIYYTTHTQVHKYVCMCFYLFRCVLDVLIDLFAFAHTSSHSC